MTSSRLSFNILLSGKSLKARGLRAAGLTIAQQGSQKGLQLVSNLILTRLLFPEAFGLMALATVFVSGLSLMSDVGIRPAVIRSKRAGEAIFQSTAWTLQVLRGTILATLAWVLAWPYAALYEAPELFAIVGVSAMSTAIAGFGSIGIILKERDLILGWVVALRITTQALTIAITVLLAWWLQSVWALAIGHVAGATLNMALGHFLFRSPNHRFFWDRDVLNEILSYGRWILLGTFFTYLGGRGLHAIQGAVVDLDTLAFLVIAFQFAWLIGEVQSGLLGSVVFPALSQIARDRPHDLPARVQRTHRLFLLVSLPGFLLLSLNGEQLIDLLYDQRYAAAGTYLRLAALGAAVGAMPMVYQNALLATGDSRTHAVVMAIVAALRILAVLVGFQLGGVIGILVASIIALAIVSLISLIIAIRNGYGDPMVDFAAYFLLTVTCAWQLSDILQISPT